MKIDKKGYKLKVAVFNGKGDCLRTLGERVCHARVDQEIYKIIRIRAEILILYGETSEARRLLEDCLKYYMHVGNLQEIELKKSIINTKGAV